MSVMPKNGTACLTFGGAMVGLVISHHRWKSRCRTRRRYLRIRGEIEREETFFWARPWRRTPLLRRLVLEWTDFALTHECRPVLAVELHELVRHVHRLLLGFHLHDGESANHLLGLGKWTVDDAKLAALEADTSAVLGRLEPGRFLEDATLEPVLNELS